MELWAKYTTCLLFNMPIHKPVVTEAGYLPGPYPDQLVVVVVCVCDQSCCPGSDYAGKGGA